MFLNKYVIMNKDFHLIITLGDKNYIDDTVCKKTAETSDEVK